MPVVDENAEKLHRNDRDRDVRPDIAPVVPQTNERARDPRQDANDRAAATQIATLAMQQLPKQVGANGEQEQESDEQRANGHANGTNGTTNGTNGTNGTTNGTSGTTNGVHRQDANQLFSDVDAKAGRGAPPSAANRAAAMDDFREVNGDLGRGAPPSAANRAAAMDDFREVNGDLGRGAPPSKEDRDAATQDVREVDLFRDVHADGANAQEHGAVHGAPSAAGRKEADQLFRDVNGGPVHEQSNEFRASADVKTAKVDSQELFRDVKDAPAADGKLPVKASDEIAIDGKDPKHRIAAQIVDAKDPKHPHAAVAIDGKAVQPAKDAPQLDGHPIAKKLVADAKQHAAVDGKHPVVDGKQPAMGKQPANVHVDGHGTGLDLGTDEEQEQQEGEHEDELLLNAINPDLALDGMHDELVHQEQQVATDPNSAPQALANVKRATQQKHSAVQAGVQGKAQQTHAAGAQRSSQIQAKGAQRTAAVGHTAAKKADAAKQGVQQKKVEKAKNIGELKTRLEESFKTKDAAFKADMEAQRADLKTKLDAEKKKLEAEIKAQEAKLAADIAAKTADVDKKIAEKKKALDARIDADGKRAEATTKAEETKLRAATAAEVTKIETQGKAEAEKAKKDGEKEGASARSKGNAEAQQAIARANAAAGGVPAGDNQAAQASAARAKGQAEASQIHSRSEGEAKAAVAKGAAEAEKRSATTKQLAEKARAKGETSIAEQQTKLAETKAQLAKDAAAGVAEMEVEKKNLLADVQKFVETAKKEMAVKTDESNVRINQQEKEALAKIDALESSTKKKNQSSHDDMLIKLESGSAADLAKLEEETNKAVEEIGKAVTIAQTNVRSEITAAQKDVALQTQQRIAAVQAEGTKAQGLITARGAETEQKIEAAAKKAEDKIKATADQHEIDAKAKSTTAQAELLRMGDKGVEDLKKSSGDYEKQKAADEAAAAKAKADEEKKKADEEKAKVEAEKKKVEDEARAKVAAEAAFRQKTGDAAAALDKAMKGMGTDEKAIFAALKGKSAEEIAAIKAAYQGRTGRTLDADLADEMSGSELGEAKALLAQDPVQSKVQALRNAMEGWGTDEKKVKETLNSITDPELKKKVVAEYEKATGERLNKVLADEGMATEGVNPDDFKKDKGPGVAVDPEQVKKLAESKDTKLAASAILAATDRWGTDEAAISNALKGKSPAEIEAIKIAFKEHSGGKDLDDVLEDEMEGTALKEAKALMSGDPVQAAVAQLHNASDGWGTDKDKIHATLKDISDPELRKQVKEQYEKQTGESLDAMLQDELSGFDKDKAKAYLGGNKGEIAAVNADEAMHGGFLTNIADGLADTAGVDRKIVRDAVGGSVATVVMGPFAPLAGPILGTKIGTDFGTDNKALYEALESCKDEKERQALKDEYKKRTGKDLMVDVDADLEGKEKDVAKFIMAGDKASAEAAKMAAAADGLGTDKKAIYEALEKAESKAEREAMIKKYNELYGKTGENFDKMLDGELGKLDLAKAKQLEKTGKTEDGFALYYAMNEGFLGIGTDDQLLKERLKGKSKEEIAKLQADYAKAAKEQGGVDNANLAEDVMGETSGRDGHELKQALKGNPTTLEEMRARAKEDYAFERTESSWVGETGMAVLMGPFGYPAAKLMGVQPTDIANGLTDSWSGTGKRLDQTDKDIEKKYAAIKADAKYANYENLPVGSPERAAMDKAMMADLQGAADWQEGDLKGFQEAKDATADMAGTAVAIAVGAVITIASGGTAAPAVVALISGLAGVGAKMLIRGGSMSNEEIVTEVASVIAEACAAGFVKLKTINTFIEKVGALAGASNKLLGTIVQEALEEAIESGSEELLNAMLDPQLYKGDLADWAKGVSQRTGKAMFTGALAGGISGGAGDLAPDPSSWQGKTLKAGANQALGSVVTSAIDPNSYEGSVEDKWTKFGRGVGEASLRGMRDSLGGGNAGHHAQVDSHVDTNTNTDTHADTKTNANTNTHANTSTDTNTATDAKGPQLNSDGGPVQNAANTNTNTSTNVDPSLNTVVDPNAAANPNPNAANVAANTNVDANQDPNANQDPKAKADLDKVAADQKAAKAQMQQEAAARVEAETRAEQERAAAETAAQLAAQEGRAWAEQKRQLETDKLADEEQAWAINETDRKQAAAEAEAIKKTEEAKAWQARRDALEADKHAQEEAMWAADPAAAARQTQLDTDKAYAELAAAKKVEAAKLEAHKKFEEAKAFEARRRHDEKLKAKAEADKQAQTDAMWDAHDGKKGKVDGSTDTNTTTDTTKPKGPTATFADVQPGQVPANATAKQKAAFEEANKLYDKLEADSTKEKARISEDFAYAQWAQTLKDVGIIVDTGIKDGGPRTKAIEATRALARQGKQAQNTAEVSVGGDSSMSARSPTQPDVSHETSRQGFYEAAHRLAGVEVASITGEKDPVMVIRIAGPNGTKIEHTIKMLAPDVLNPGQIAGQHLGDSSNESFVWVSGKITDDQVARALGGVIQQVAARAGGKTGAALDQAAKVGQLDAMIGHLESIQAKAAPAPGDNKIETQTAKAKQESPARVNAELDLMLLRMGLTPSSPDFEAKLAELPAGVATKVRALTENRQTLQFNADGVVTDPSKVAKPEPSTGTLTSTVLAQAPTETTPYTAAQQVTVAELRVALQTIAEIDQRLAQRDVKGTNGDKGAIAQGETMRRRELLKVAKGLMADLQLGGTDSKYYDARLAELEAVFPGVGKDIAPMVKARVEDKLEADKAHAEAKAYKERAQQQADDIENKLKSEPDPFLGGRVVIGDGPAGLANLATLDHKPGADGYLDPKDCLVVGGMDLIGKMADADASMRWGQRAGVFDPTTGADPHAIFKGQDKKATGELQRTSDDAGDFATVGAVSDAMDLARARMGVARVNATVLKIERRPADMNGWPPAAGGHAVRATIQFKDGTTKVVYLHNADLTTGVGSASLPEAHIMGESDRKQLAKNGALLGGEDLMTGASMEGKRVLVMGFGPTGAWASYQAAMSKGKVDWSGSSMKAGANDAEIASLKGIDRVQEAFDPKNNINTTSDRILKIKAEGKGAIVTYIRGTPPNQETYTVPYDVIVSALPPSSTSKNTVNGGENNADSVLEGIDMRPQGPRHDGDVSPILESGENGDADGAIRVMGAAAWDGVGIKDKADREELTNRREAMKKNLSADSPDARVMEATSEAAINANKPKTEPPAVSSTPVVDGPDVGPQTNATTGTNVATDTQVAAAPVATDTKTAFKTDVNQDGVQDGARVGVKGTEIPTQIPRLEGLPPEQAAAEARFAAAYERDPEALAKEYLALVTSGETDKEMKNFATDDAKLLSPDYNPATTDGADPNAKLAARGMMNIAVHQTANAVAKLAFQMRLDQIMADPTAAKQILVTAGGVGAGKSYAIDNNPQALALKQQSSAVWDSAGEQNSTELPWVIAEAKKRGIEVSVVYVHRRPEQSWENMKFGVIPRAAKSGRMVDARLHADSYAEGARNFDAVHQQLAEDPTVKFVVIDATGEKPQQIDHLPESALNLDADTVHARNIAFLDSQKQNLPDFVVQGGNGIGSQLWGDAQKALPSNPADAQALKDMGVTWGNPEVHANYLAVNASIAPLNEGWKQQGLGAEERARRAFQVRHEARLTGREMMGDATEVDRLRAADTKDYGHQDGPTFDQLVEKQRIQFGKSGDEAFEAIIGSSQRTNASVNASLGLAGASESTSRTVDLKGETITPSPVTEPTPVQDAEKVAAEQGSDTKPLTDEQARAQWEQTPASARLQFPPLPGERRATIRQDVVAEKLAHGLAYRDADALTQEDHAYLKEQGLQLGTVIHGVGGLEMTTFIPLPGSNAAPVLAFRGTKGKADLIDDTNPAGIGAYQMAANEGIIAATLAALSAQGGPPTVTGHSLGGALAQMTAVRFSSMIGRVVTFQSPGISKKMVAELDEYNKQAEATGGKKLESHHYEVAGDLVSLAGEAFTEGFRTVIDRGTDIATEVPAMPSQAVKEHTAYPLETFVKSGEGLGSWPTGGSRLDGRGPASAYTAGPNDWNRPINMVRKFAEAMRVGTGRALQIFERVSNLGAAPRQNYIEVWQRVRDAVDQGAETETVISLIESSKIRGQDKQMMIDNLRALVASAPAKGPPKDVS